MKPRVIVGRGCLAIGVGMTTACQDSGLSPREGFVEVPGDRVWYRIVPMCGSWTA
jgi:hypothetical protein